jgi:hypothetical protein
VQKKK